MVSSYFSFSNNVRARVGRGQAIKGCFRLFLCRRLTTQRKECIIQSKNYPYRDLDSNLDCNLDRDP